jgi:hypothetical protein
MSVLIMGFAGDIGLLWIRVTLALLSLTTKLLSLGMTKLLSLKYRRSSVPAFHERRCCVVTLQRDSGCD